MAETADSRFAPSALAEKIPADGRILFCRRDRETFGFFSNFHEVPVEIDQVVWATTEHYYQAQKSKSAAYQEAILAAQTPGKAKRLGNINPGSRSARRNSWFTGRMNEVRPDWDDCKIGVMRTALQAKFTQHRHLKLALLATTPAEIVEDSRTDVFWGCGVEGDGQNWLGRLLMELRAELSEER